MSTRGQQQGRAQGDNDEDEHKGGGKGGGGGDVGGEEDGGEREGGGGRRRRRSAPPEEVKGGGRWRSLHVFLLLRNRPCKGGLTCQRSFHVGPRPNLAYHLLSLITISL